MTAIIIPRRHLAQPQGRVEIDRSHPLGGLIRGGGYVSPQGGVISHDATLYEGGEYGAAVVSDGFAGDFSQTRARFAYAAGWSSKFDAHVLLAMVAIAPASANSGTIIQVDRNLSVTRPFVALQINSGGGFRAGHNDAVYEYTDTVTVPQGRLLPVAVKWVPNTSLAIFVGGHGESIVPSANNDMYGGVTTNEGFEFRAPAQNSGLVAFGYYIEGTPTGGVPSDEELRDWVGNPWTMFRADPIRVYSLPSSGTEQALAASGSATATGSTQLAASIALAGVGVALAGGSGTLSGAQSAPLAATGTAAASGTAAPRIDIALSALGLSIATGTATLDAATAGSLAASGSASASGSAAAAANVTISAAGLAQAAAAAGLSAQVLLAGAGAAAAAGNAALAAQLRAAATGGAQASGTATITGSAAGQLTAGGSAQALGSAALVVSVRLAAAGSAAATGAGAVDAGTSQALAGSGQAGATGAAQVVAEVVLTGAGFVQAMGVGYLVVQVDLAGAGAAVADGAAAAVDAGALVLISVARWRVDAAGRRFTVDAAGRRWEVSA